MINTYNNGIVKNVTRLEVLITECSSVSLKLNNYLLKLSTKNARILCKFRSGNVKLPIETSK